MTTAQERLVEWLRDAYAAEEQAQSMLTRTARQIDTYPEFRAGLERHGERSGGQAERLKQCLADLGEGPSILKQLTGQITALGQTLGGYVVGDEAVKAALATSTFAHMEISSYRILVVAAEAAGKTEIAKTCEILLAEEVAFADWLDDQVPLVTTEYLRRETGAQGATTSDSGMVTR